MNISTYYLIPLLFITFGILLYIKPKEKHDIVTLFLISSIILSSTLCYKYNKNYEKLSLPLDNIYLQKIDLDNPTPKKGRVVVSFSTIPSRIKFVPTVIDRLKNQDMKPDMIYACIPYFSKRKNIKYEIPEEWNNLEFQHIFTDKVKVVRCDDFGPATKLLGCIPYEDDPETMIITIDDDHEYPPSSVSDIVSYAIKYPNSCLSRQAMNESLDPAKCSNREFNITNPEVQYLEGFGAPLYRRKFITDEMLDFFKNLSDECFVSDDLTISSWLQMQNVSLIKLCFMKGGKIDNEIDSYDALHDDNRHYVYTKCFKEMDRLKFMRKYIWCKSYSYMADKYEPFRRNINKDKTQNIIKIDVIPDIDLKNYEDIEDGSIISIRTYQLPDFINYIFSRIYASIVLITTDSDESIPSDIWRNYQGGLNALPVRNLPSPIIGFDEFLNSPRLLHWYTSNFEDKFKHDKITPIPLGLDYHTLFYSEGISPYSQEKDLQDVIDNIKPFEKRPNKVYATFQFNDSYTRFRNSLGEDRKTIYAKLKNNKNIYFEPKKIPRKQYWDNHSKYSFVLSPVGNGLDCHRTWEALILGCIPIVKTSPIDDVYKDLPVIIIKDWDEITSKNLNMWKKLVLENKDNYKLEKLTSEYWNDKIKTTIYAP